MVITKSVGTDPTRLVSKSWLSLLKNTVPMPTLARWLACWLACWVACGAAAADLLDGGMACWLAG